MAQLYDDGNKALLLNGGIGGGVGASGGVSIYSYKDMDTIDDLNAGISTSVGGGIAFIGGSTEITGEYITESISFSGELKFLPIPKDIIIGYYGTVNGSVIIWRN